MVKAGTWTRTTTSIVGLGAAFLHGCATFLPATLAHAGDNVGFRSQNEESGRRQLVGIVIMAQGRSGSTMLGETFRQSKVGWCMLCLWVF